MKRIIYILPVVIAALIAIHAWSVSPTTDKKTLGVNQAEQSLNATGTENTTRTPTDAAAEIFPDGLLPGQVEQNLGDTPPREAPSAETSCVRSGCGGILCTSPSEATPPDASCNIQPHFACFDDAVCEVQDSGKCGWTQSDSLSACLINYIQM